MATKYNLKNILGFRVHVAQPKHNNSEIGNQI